MTAVDLLVYVVASAPAWWLMLRIPRLPALRGARGPVSVIIPARNEEHQIADVVRAVVNETQDGDEVIVVDDGSSDATAERAVQAGAKVIQAGDLPSLIHGDGAAYMNIGKYRAGKLPHLRNRCRYLTQLRRFKQHVQTNRAVQVAFGVCAKPDAKTSCIQ